MPEREHGAVHAATGPSSAAMGGGWLWQTGRESPKMSNDARECGVGDVLGD